MVGSSNLIFIVNIRYCSNILQYPRFQFSYSTENCFSHRQLTRTSLHQSCSVIAYPGYYPISKLLSLIAYPGYYHLSNIHHQGSITTITFLIDLIFLICQKVLKMIFFVTFLIDLISSVDKSFTG